MLNIASTITCLHKQEGPRKPARAQQAGQRHTRLPNARNHLDAGVGRLRGAVRMNQHARDRRAQSRPTMSAAGTRRGSGSQSVRGSWPTIPSPCSDNQEPQDRQVGRTGRDQRSHKDLAKQALLRTARLARSRRGSMVRTCCESAHGIFGCGHPRLPLMPQPSESGHQRPPKPTRTTLCGKPACHSESPFLEWLLSAGRGRW